MDASPVDRTPLGITLAFIAVGGACVVFAAFALAGRKSSAASYVDPLEGVVAEHVRAAASGALHQKPTDLASQEVTFPGILSDRDRPTTALAAVRGNSRAVRSEGGAVPAPPQVPAPPVLAPPASASATAPALPAQAVLEATPVVTRPRDALTRAASESAQIGQAAAPSAPVGKLGGYQLQISSFRNAADATKFCDQLRARGHKAYVVEAHVPARAASYRVRIGPFASQQQAAAYRERFEAKEHVVPFLMQPKEGDPP